MGRRILRIIGIGIIVAAIGIWWLLDRFGCEMNTSGCSRVLPRFTLETVEYLFLPVALGVFLIYLGRRQRG